MIPQISSALSNGFTTKQVIDFLLKKFPQHSEKIKSAMAAGFTTDQVIKFLSGGKKEMSEETSNQTEHEQTRGVYAKQRANVNKAGAAVAGLGATALAAPMAVQALKRAIPQNLLGSIPQPSQQEQAISPEITASQTQQPPVSQPNIAQPQQPIQPEVKTIDVGSLLNKSGLKKHVDDLSKRIKDPKQIAAVLYSKYPDEMKAFQKESGKNMEDAIGDYLSNAKETQNPTQKQQMLEPSGKELDVSKEIEGNQPTKIGKSSIVASPNGIGTVKELRNGNVLIDVDGKLHKVKEEDLELPEFSPDEIADAYDDLMAKIPEEHRSGFISWAGYDEDRNVLGFIPRGGKYEELHNITPEEASIIKEGKGVARTTGANREGLWAIGEDTRGGLISQIIHDRRKKNKSEDEKQLSFGLDLQKPEKQDRGMKPLFDEMSHARNLSRDREKKAKDEERAKKKKEKDEAKKRKK